MKYNMSWQSNVFSADKCQELINEYAPKIEKALTYEEGESTVRKSNIVWVFDQDLKRYIFDIISSHNRQGFGFLLDFTYFDLQFTEYLAEEGGHYDWHIDTVPSSSKTRQEESIFDRKLSITILLSDPSEFQGGDLEFVGEPMDPRIYKQQGAAVIFPSFLAHRVSPVTQGKRYSLVAWIEGPQFR